MRDAPLQASDWLAADWLQGDWRAKPLADGTLQLSENGVPKGSVVLDPRLEGRPRCYCWIADRQGKPFAIAVGTDVQNSIYVYRLVEKGPCPVLRHFRGHHDYVTSLGGFPRSAVAGLVLGRRHDHVLEPLGISAGGGNAGPLGRRVRGRRRADWSLKTLDPAGPLFRKGLREGDVVTAIRWPAEAGRSHGEPAGGNPGSAADGALGDAGRV